MSILKALEHTGPYFGTEVEIKWIETTDLKTGKDAEKALSGVDGIIVPGGFGARGIEGKILCIEHARKNRIPFLGLCYGMQLAVIEFCRNVLDLKDANSTEIDPKTKNPVIDILPEQKGIKELGGTMRLGAYPAVLRKGTLVQTLYGKEKVSERHRHRFEVNPEYIDRIEAGGLVFSGRSPGGKLMEFLELPEHPFFAATQAHPEFTSKPLNPNPLFKGFIQACLEAKK
jgi:CTP synthase